MSDFNQASFLGGMNLLSDDTRLESNQYRLGLNIRNRYDILDEIKDSVEDTAAPTGTKQGMVTFGNYIVLFSGGNAYYRLYNSTGWKRISNFKMSSSAPRFWTEAIPVALTNYVRYAGYATIDGVAQFNTADGAQPLKQLNVVVGSASGNLPGLLVQDNINQPMFIFVTSDGPVARTTQNYGQWHVDYDEPTGTMLSDAREYVPIGSVMAFVDGKLYIASQDGSIIYQSVSGRPLDFVVNVQTNGQRGGDAGTMGYSVGAEGITCLRGTPDGSLFVAAGNSNYIVSKNYGNNATLIFGEFPLTRKFLMEATCIDDRCIIDSAGDTKFIDLNGIRSFNAIKQLANEGRNSAFSATIQSALDGIVQSVAAAILYDNYELYAMNTIYGQVIAVFDTISNCWVGFDTTQTGGVPIKQFAKIELGVRRLFAITTDDKVYTLYAGSTSPTATVVTGSLNSCTEWNGQSYKNPNPKTEIKLLEFRCILDKIAADSTVTIMPVIDNHLSKNVTATTKLITYKQSVEQTLISLPNLGKQLTNLYFPVPNCEQGWKTSVILQWTGGGSIVQYSMMLRDETPLNPLKTQATTK
jgi:hypothetical protein